MFAITKDHDADLSKRQGTNSNAVGVVGPSSARLSFNEIVNHKNGRKFRMLTDDRDLVYEGVWIANGLEDGEFEPLECFGTPNYGCTIIQFWNNGWKDF